MKITKEFLESENACAQGMRFVAKEKLIGLEDVDFLESLIKAEKLDWANWLIVRVMDHKRCVSYAIFAAEQVIDSYEKNHPEDKRPRNAIKAAKKCLKNPTDKNKDAAYAAANAAANAAKDAAYAAANAAANAANDAANAAYAAANAAYAADAAYAAANAANDAYAADDAAAAYAAAAYAAAADDADADDADAAAAYAAYAMKVKILKYGINLLKGAKKC